MHKCTVNVLKPKDPGRQIETSRQGALCALLLQVGAHSPPTLQLHPRGNTGIWDSCMFSWALPHCLSVVTVAKISLEMESSNINQQLSSNTMQKFCRAPLKTYFWESFSLLRWYKMLLYKLFLAKKNRVMWLLIQQRDSGCVCLAIPSILQW